MTRGTTNPNRLRRVDRWIAATAAQRLRGVPRPLVVDLGYGSSPRTAVELYDRLAAVVPQVELTGIEIEPGRVREAQPFATERLQFIRGGFEVPTDRPPQLIRAFNVLRQYEEADVDAIWATLRSRLAPGGLLVEGTCDELGRLATWVALEKEGPVSLSLSLRFGSYENPSECAARLPKALIHHNIPGQAVHTFLEALDQAWWAQAPLAAFGSRQRWMASCASLRAAGWPVLDGAARWRLGEITLAWSAVA